jgi:hypothetical protein
LGNLRLAWMHRSQERSSGGVQKISSRRARGQQGPSPLPKISATRPSLGSCCMGCRLHQLQVTPTSCTCHQAYLLIPLQKEKSCPVAADATSTQHGPTPSPYGWSGTPSFPPSPLAPTEGGPRWEFEGEGNTKSGRRDLRLSCRHGEKL